MGRPIVKYLDPISGEYEYSTVIDVGDLTKLNTTIKTDLVSAINSIVANGVSNGSGTVPEGLINEINRLKNTIDSLKNGTFEIVEWGSIDDYYKQKFDEKVEELNNYNREQIDLSLIEVEKIKNKAIEDLDEKVANSETRFTEAQQSLDNAKTQLDETARKLETADINYNELKTTINEIDNYIETKIKNIEFDNMNAMMLDYETLVRQTAEEFGIDASKETLSYLNGRVADAHARLSVTNNLISTKIDYDEFQYIPLPEFNYAENLLRYTMDFSKEWSRTGTSAFVSNEVLFHGKVIQYDDNTGSYQSKPSDLVTGDTYTLSVYINIQPDNLQDDKFKPTSRAFNPNEFNFSVAGVRQTVAMYEDLRGINGWMRVYATFVAPSTNPNILFSFSGLTDSSLVGYVALPKLEKNTKVTPWQPHVEDDYSTLLSQKSIVRQYGDRVEAYARETQQLNDSFIDSTASFEMMAEGFRLNTEAVQSFESQVGEYKDAVVRYGSEVSALNDSINLKVWEDDFRDIVEEINIDNRNRVLNSDFVRNEIDPSTRALVVDNWTLQDSWGIENLEGSIYLKRSRTGLTNVNVTSATSDYFITRKDERLMFGFDLIYSGLDDNSVFALDFFDINNSRLLRKEFKLSELSKHDGTDRYYGTYQVTTNGVKKAKAVLKLPKNGTVRFTKVQVQSGNIGFVDWSQAPEDSWIVQSKLQSQINVVKDSVKILSEDERIDVLTGMLVMRDGKYVVSPEAIVSEVTKTELGDRALVTGSQFKQTAEGWEQRLVSKEGIIQGINASEESYKISFDKVEIDGELIAGVMSGQTLDLSKGFRLANGGNTVIYADAEGKVIMQPSELRIGNSKAATVDDINRIELTPGPKGDSGNGIQSMVTYYLATNANSGITRGSAGWTIAIQTMTSTKQYLWSYTRTNYTNGNIGYTEPAVIGRYGVDGSNGRDGADGKDGVGVSVINIIEYYLATNLSSGITRNSSGWTSTVQSISASKQYLWNYEETVLSNGTSHVTPPVIIGRYGVDGADGTDGTNGRGIASITEYYLVNNVNTGVTHQTSGWSTAFKTTSPTNKYLWNYEVIKYTDNTEYKSIPVIISAHGEKGADGVDGKDGVAGKDGVGLKSTVIEYGVSSSGVNKPTTWSLSVPTVSQGQYQWTRTTWNYTDGTSEQGFTNGRIGKDGATGSDGIAGKDGVGIINTTINYAKSTSGTVRPTTGWGSTIPVVNNGEYLWTRTLWNYSDGTNETGYSVARMGQDGAKGADGRDGKDGEKGADGRDGIAGKDGVGVTSTTITYALSTSGLVAPSSGYTSTVPTLIKGQFLWTKTVWAYTDGSTESGYSVTYVAKDGNNGTDGIAGKDGVGITSTVITYAKGTSGLTPPSTGWETAIPTVEKGGYLWTKTVWNYTDNTRETGFSVARMGLDGENGKDGIAGKDGVGLRRTVVEYAISASGTSSPTTGYSTAVPNLIKGQYLWTRTTWTYSDNSNETGYSVSYIAKDGNNGTDGIAGKDGVGISDTLITYAKSTNGTTSPVSGWSATIPTVNNGEYLWTKTVWTYTDNTKETGYSVARMGQDGAKGDKGDKGDRGDQGPQGVSGTGISSSITTYQIHTNGTTPPTGTWVSNVPSPEKGKYLWSRTIVNYTSGDPSTTYSVSYYATDGQKGVDGKGITSSVIEYAQTANTTQPTEASFSTTRPVPIKGQYLWTRTTINYSDGTKSVSYNTSYHALDGQDGDDKYIWIKFSANANGTPIQNTPQPTTKYLGLAYNKDTATESNNPADYIWTKIEGEKGIQGEKGADGKPNFTWVRYSPHPDGSDMTSLPDKDSVYIGIAINKQTETPSNVKTDYVWSLFKGRDSDEIIKITTPSYPLTTPYTQQNGLVFPTIYGNTKHSVPVGDGRNYFNKQSTISVKTAGSGFVARGSETPNGFKFTGGQAETSSVRINDVIDSNGWWTVSFDIKGNQSALVGVTVDIADLGATKITTNNTNTYERRSVSVNVTNYPSYKFVDFDNFDWANFFIDNIKIEKGQVATPYTPAPEDIPQNLLSVGNEVELVSSVGRENLLKDSQSLDKQSTNTNLNQHIMSKSKESLIVGEKYILSFDIKSDVETSSAYIFLNSTLRIYDSFIFKTDWTRYSVEFEYNGDTYSNAQIYPHLYPGENGSMKYIRNFKLEKVENREFSGSNDYSPSPTDISYDTPYPTIYKTNLTLPQPLRSVGDVKDKLFRDSDGVWKIERKIGEVIIDGSQSGGWSIGDSTIDSNYGWFYKSQTLLGMDRPYLYASPVIMSSFSDTNVTGYNNLNIDGFVKWRDATPFVFSIEKSKIGTFTSAGINSWLVQNPIQVQYELATPTIETLDKPLQDKLNSLPTYSPETWVYTVNNSKTYLGEEVVPEMEGEFWGAGLSANFKLKDYATVDNVDDVNSRLNDTEANLLQMTDNIINLQEDIGNISANDFITSEEYHKSLAEELESFEANINIGPIRTTTEAIDKNFTFSDSGLVVGSENEPSKVRIGNDRIEMINDNKIPMYITGGVVYADNFVTNNGLTFVNHATSNYNNKTIFRYVGQ